MLASTNEASFEPVPQDALINILNKLNPAGLAQAECADQRCRKLVVANSLWRCQCCNKCVNFARAVADVDPKVQDTAKISLPLAGLNLQTCSAGDESHLHSLFYKRLCSHMCSAPSERIGEDSLIVRKDSEMRMMDASIDLLQVPETKQLILDDPQLLLIKLEHPLTLVEEIRIGASYQRALEVPCQQIRFTFGLAVSQLYNQSKAPADDEGTMSSRTFTVDHAAAAKAPQHFVFKPLLCVGALVKIELIQDEQSLPSAARAGMYNITLLGRCLRSFRVKGQANNIGGVTLEAA